MAASNVSERTRCGKYSQQHPCDLNYTFFHINDENMNNLQTRLLSASNFTRRAVQPNGRVDDCDNNNEVSTIKNVLGSTEGLRRRTQCLAFDLAECALLDSRNYGQQIQLSKSIFRIRGQRFDAVEQRPLDWAVKYLLICRQLTAMDSVRPPPIANGFYWNCCTRFVE